MKTFRASANLFPAFVAAVTSFLFVMSEDHVHFIAGDRKSYFSPLMHRCGLAMLSCFAWLITELVRSAFFPKAHAERSHFRLGGTSFAGRVVR